MNKEKSILTTKQKFSIGFLLTTAVFLFTAGAYSYYVSVSNNNQNQSANIQTGNMALNFSDGNNGINDSLNFGESVVKTFTIENTGSLEAKAKINWLNLTNTYLEGSLTYKFSYSESEDGEYIEIVTNKNVPVSETAIAKTLASNLTIPVGTTYYYKLEITLNYLEDIDQTADLNAILSTEFMLEEGMGLDFDELPTGEKTLTLLNLKAKEGSPNFAEVATTDETADGLYTMEDDYGTSYYFRGAVENNYVKFGGFYWRIIRINGDGSLRMIYDGTSAHANGASDTNRLALTSVAWNPSYNDAKYVGYMYSPSGTTASTSKEQAQTNEVNTNIKTQIENWYKTNIRDKGLDGYVADSIYCNDRTILGKSETKWTNDTGLGYGENVTGYGAFSRFMTGNNSTTLSARTDPSPTFVCPNKNDAFTKENEERGNGKLGEKVGLITADEIVAAGSGKYATANSNYYLYKGNWYWSLSPSNYYSSAYVFIVNSDGQLYGTYVYRAAGGVAPVISLSAEYVSTLRGEGTRENPYEI